MIPRILVIAGSDSGGGAGIQADIKTITMLGGHAMTAITAITAQNTLGVTAIMQVSAEMVLTQMEAVISDLGVDAVKIGMIGSAATAEAVADRLERLDVPIVFDPVMVATSGSTLADEATIAAFRRLMTIATLVTPNAPELEVLSGRDITTVEDLQDAALDLAHETGAAILAKGGHIRGDIVSDTLVAAGETMHFESPRIETSNTHGTGCTLASAIACGLGHGTGLAGAVERARNYTLAAIKSAPGFGSGHGPLGHALTTMPYGALQKLG